MTNVRLYENSRACSVGFPYDEIDREDTPEPQPEQESGYAQDLGFVTKLNERLGKECAGEVLQMLDAEMKRRERQAFLDGFKLAAKWTVGPKWEEAAVLFSTGSPNLTDGEIADKLGVSRQAVGKFHRRLRKNAGRPLRAPQCSNGEEIRAAVAAKKKQNQKKQKDAQ